MLSLIKTIEDQPWKNWAHTSMSRPVKTLYPRSMEEVCIIVMEAVKQNKKLRVVGAGHSFTNLVMTNDWLISLDELSGIEQLDEGEETVTVLAGTRLFQIGKELGEKGYSQENLGDINIQSIAGAISTSTHGTGIAFGSIATQVMELTLVTANGELMIVSEKSNPAYFKASLVSLGTLGIIVKVKLKIIKCPVYEYKREKVDFSYLKEHLESLISSNQHFEFYLFPFSDIVQIKTMNSTNNKPQNVKSHHFKNLILENYLFYAISETCRLFPKTSSFFSKLSAKAVGTASISAPSFQLFATPRLVRFREIEYCIPKEYAIQVLSDIRKRIEEKRYNVHFPIECRTVKADDIWLSPSYKRDSLYIAFHMYNGMPYEEYFRDMEQIVDKYEGRPHWGKMHTRNYKDLVKLYPKFTDFLAIRKELDPNNLFLNDYLKELFTETTKIN